MPEGKSDIKSDIKSQTKDSYETVGFHRILGGFYYNLILLLIGNILLVGLAVVIIPILLPYPEIEGYSKVTYGLLGFAFGFFDFGSTKGSESHAQMNDGLLRYLGEYADKAPYQAVRYIQFFIFFQMATGIIQITLISVLVFQNFFSTMAYLAYFILGYSLIQFPGCTQIFESIFRGFVRLDAYSLFMFLKDSVIRFGVQILCVVIGRSFGMANPQFGELMGATIGYIVSLWIIELTNFFFGMIIFRNKIGKRLHISIIDLFRPDFTKEVAKNTLSFSMKLWIGGLIGQFVTTLSNVVILSLMPSYAVWVGLLSFADQISGFITMGGQMTRNSTAALSEAYLNKKYALFDYYLMNLLKYNVMITFYMLIPILILFPPVLGSIIYLIPSLENYAPLVSIVPMFFTFNAIYNGIESLSGRLLISTDHPTAFVVIGTALSPLKVIMLVIFVLNGLSWQAIILSTTIAVLTLSLSYCVYYHFKIRRLPFFNKGFLWQSFIASVLAIGSALPLLLIIHSWMIIGLEVSPLVTGILVIILCLIVFPIFVFSPLYGLFGGFDKNGLLMFEKALALSGPSRWLMKLFYLGFRSGYHISPTKEKLVLPLYDESEQERIELMQLSKK